MEDPAERTGRRASVSLPYGRGRVELAIDDSVHLLEPRCPPPVADLHAAISEALDAPVGAPRLEELARGARSVVVLVPDKSRNARSPEVLGAVLERLEAASVPRGAVTVIVAAGDHPRHTPEELAATAGPALAGGVALREHVAADEATCVEVGVTRRGTPVRLHRLVVEAELRVLTGAVSHHYFAGFGGGPKALFPGAASRSSIRANHALVLSEGRKDPRTCLGRLDGNPLHEDLSEAAAMAGPSFLVNLVLDGEDRPLAAFAGGVREAHRRACGYLDRVASLPEAAGPYDLLAVAAGGRPHDLNLVQAHKALDRCAPLVRDGGTMVALAACDQGYGDPDLERYLAGGSAEAVLEDLGREFRVKAHTALCLFLKTARIRICLQSGLAPGPLRAAGMVPVADAAAEWSRLLDGLPRGSRAGVVPAGHFGVPRFGECFRIMGSRITT